MSILKFKEDGVFKSVLAIKGEKGDTGAGVKSGGSAGQVLAKASSTDYDTTWTTVSGTGDMIKAVYDTDSDGKVNSADSADSVAWSGVTGKPSTFTPSSHTHTKSEVTDFSHTHTKSEVTDFSHTHTKSDVTDFAHTHTKSEVTDFAHTHDDRYYTESEVDTLMSGKANSSHTHTKANITDFSHTHTKSEVTDFAHTHTLSDVSDVTATASELNLLDGATSDNVRKTTVSTTDIGVGATLPTGELYFVYE